MTGTQTPPAWMLCDVDLERHVLLDHMFRDIGHHLEHGRQEARFLNSIPIWVRPSKRIESLAERLAAVTVLCGAHSTRSGFSAGRDPISVAADGWKLATNWRPARGDAKKRS
ncbi:hypothetical protein E1832_19895 [Antarcticimicrobium luteum]|uniref:Uncharacterized protein n=2 Tax=Antarcticimicrobium luteum TaxID=2547397 RepID=A0A4V3AQE6_9RHOB|nr:hypothetical protein E1832_19895 [Antarcticimicrobium luteum]